MFKIATCNCKHAWQDRKYGKRRRVHNKRANGGHRCTVCGHERD